MNFADFAADKTRRAVAAVLPPYVTQLSAPELAPAPVAIGNAWTIRLFDGPFYVSRPEGGRPACSLVFVQSADGNTGAADPSALGGGETDKHLIYEGLSRAAADAVIAGAGTVRGGDIFFSVWHPELVTLRATLGKPRHPIQIVATMRGLDLDRTLLFNVPEVPAIVITVTSVAGQMAEAVRARPWLTMIEMPDQQGLPDAFTRLTALGVATISCVGGRTLARQLFDADLVDDVYLTTSACRGGEPGTALHTRPWRDGVVLKKAGSGQERGVTFEHIRAVRR